MTARQALRGPGDAHAGGWGDAHTTTRIVVASANPVKREATRLGFVRALGVSFGALEIDTVAVPSGVADQPMSDGETLRGAMQRARAAAREQPDASYWVGLEGGLMPRRVDRGPGEDRHATRRVLEAFGWVVVRDAAGREGRARSAGFELPPAVTRAVLDDGLELGEAIDRLAGTVGSKHRGGAVGRLTGGALRRAELYAPAVLLALMPLLQPALYDDVR